MAGRGPFSYCVPATMDAKSITTALISFHGVLLMATISLLLLTLFNQRDDMATVLSSVALMMLFALEMTSLASLFSETPSIEIARNLGALALLGIALVILMQYAFRFWRLSYLIAVCTCFALAFIVIVCFNTMNAELKKSIGSYLRLSGHDGGPIDRTNQGERVSDEVKTPLLREGEGEDQTSSESSD